MTARCQTAASFATLTSLIAWPRSSTRQWSVGFLAGIFDAEGSHSCGALRISNCADDVLSQTTDALTDLGIPHVVEDRQAGARPLLLDEPARASGNRRRRRRLGNGGDHAHRRGQ